MFPAGPEYATVRIMLGFLGILGISVNSSAIEVMYDASDGVTDV